VTMNRLGAMLRRALSHRSSRLILSISAMALASVVLLATCYAPAMAAAQALSAQTALSLIAMIVVSAGCACAWIALAHRSGLARWAEFGFRSSTADRAFKWGIAAFATSAALHASKLVGAEPMPAVIASQSALMLFCIIVIGASIQEELIFRGLLMTTLGWIARRAGFKTTLGSAAAICLSALLFGAMHLAIGPRTAAAATVLGVLAGAARERSDSLMPAIACHVVFNGMAWCFHVLRS